MVKRRACVLGLGLVVPWLLMPGPSALADVCQSEEVFELQSENPDPGDGFGSAVDINDGIVVIGSPRDDTAGDNTGAVYVYDNATGKLIHVLTAPEGDADLGDSFGADVAIDDGLIIVGAPGDDEAGDNAGAVYVFDAKTGDLLDKLTADDPQPGDAFGSAVDTDGTQIIVGAPKDDDNGEDSGSVYIFDPAGNQLLKMLAEDGEPGDEFGSAVAIEDAVAIIGAPHDDDNGPSSGSAYIFDTNTGQQLSKITPEDGFAGDFFGSDVGIDNGILVIGAPGDDDLGALSGSAYLFDASDGTQLHKLLADDGDPRDQFGFSVATSGDNTIVGAPFDEDAGDNAGSVYLFDTSSGDQVEKILPAAAGPFAEIGVDVAIDGDDAVIGAQFEGGAAEAVSVGKAYIFDICGGCAADINNDDDLVNVLDLLDLLRDWGDPCTGDDDCDGDLTNDGVVGIDDLLCMLASWGPCPGGDDPPPAGG